MVDMVKTISLQKNHEYHTTFAETTEEFIQFMQRLLATQRKWPSTNKNWPNYEGTKFEFLYIKKCIINAL